MDIVKKNWLSIACGVVAILAILAVPLFLSSQQTALQKALVARQKTHQEIEQVLHKSRHLPVVSIDPNATAPDLSVFPSPSVINAGKAAVDEVKKQSEELEKMAVDLNRHKVLVEGSLPEPRDAFKFQQAYINEVRKALPQQLNSVMPPNAAEIEAQIAAETEKKTAAAPKNAATGEIYNKEALQADIDAMKREMPDKLRLGAAREHKMYMIPDSALSIDPDITATGVVQNIPAERIWLAQLGLWVQQDVANAIIDVNKSAKDVADAPVKQLVLVDIPPDRQIYVLPGGGVAVPNPSGQAQASPVATNTPTDALPKDFTVSPTGRVCNGVFDVVHFTVCLHVQASDVTKVINGLEKGRLLTVYQSDVESVNSGAFQEQGYFFGPNPVVTLTLKCEELFLRSWTRPLMPAPIKQYLNVQEPAVQPTAMNN